MPAFYRLRETLLEFDCPRCNGDGWPNDQECGRCSGAGFVNADVTWLVTLVDNLAIGGALSASFKAGDNFGFHMGDEAGYQCMCQWSPNTRGEPYKGATRCEQDDGDDDRNKDWPLDEDCVP